MSNRMQELVAAPAGTRVVLQGNLAFALGCARCHIHAADGYPGTPSTEVIDKGLKHLQDRMRVGWSVNEANAVALGFGVTMAGRDAVVTMKIPGLFQAADVVASIAGYTAKRGGLVLFVASDFVPSSTQYVFDPRYFLKSCFLPILEPRDHQEMLEMGPWAVSLSRELKVPVVVLANGLLCHSEGLVRLSEASQPVPGEGAGDFTRFMNLPDIARQSYQTILSERMPALERWAADTPLNSIAWHERSLGVVVHGMTAAYLREAWSTLPKQPSVLSLGLTYPLPRSLVREFAAGLSGPVVVLSDGLRFVQEELAGLGVAVQGKDEHDATTEWSPDSVAERLGAKVTRLEPVTAVPCVPRPPGLCAGCPYRAFGLAVEKLRKQRKIVASFGDIGCNTLLYFLKAIDTCTCMGAADSKRQGVVLVDPSLAGKVISVTGDSTECHSGLASTRNAMFHGLPGVKVVLDNRTTAMTGGQPAPSSPHNLAGKESGFNLVAALAAEGARVQVVDAFDLKGIERALRAALSDAGQNGVFTTLVLQGTCMRDLPDQDKTPRLQILTERCEHCDLCLVCPGIESGEDGYPRFTHLCTSCGGRPPICVQRCNLNGIVPREKAVVASPPAGVCVGDEDEPLPILPIAGLPTTMRVAVRGVGGQGILFVGKVLAEVALAAGFARVLKGETHGMAQLGGAVISTFACGDVYSPVLAPSSVDVLMALEMAELLRPGFLPLLRPGGTVLLNRLQIVPQASDRGDYPTLDKIRGALSDRRVLEFDALSEAAAMGDTLGRSVNVIALGVLSTVTPFSLVPSVLWRRALRAASPNAAMRSANLAAFTRGRELGPRLDCLRSVMPARLDANRN